MSQALREGTGRSSAAEGRTRLRSTLVSAETALALVVLAGAGLLINSYLRLQSVELGFDPDDVLMMEIGLSRSYSSDEQRAAFFSELTDRARAIPGVISASSIVDPPIGYVMWAPPVVLEGPQEGEPPWIAAHMVGPDYFRTMGIRLLRGRGLTSSDDSGHPLVAVVNETMARELWPDGGALGRRIKLSPDPDAPWITVVGVANDIRQRSLASPRRSEFYVPYAQHAWFAWNHIVVRSEADVAAIAGLMRQALWDLDSTVPFDGVTRMNDRISSSLQAPRFRTLLLTGFAIVSLLLAAGGLYATMLYAVGQRAHEIGIRVALGADSAAVLNLVVRQGMKLTVIGVNGPRYASRDLGRSDCRGAARLLLAGSKSGTDRSHGRATGRVRRQQGAATTERPRVYLARGLTRPRAEQLAGPGTSVSRIRTGDRLGPAPDRCAIHFWPMS